MHAGDDAVGRQHEVAAGRRREDCRVVAEAKSARMRRQRPEIAGDQALLGRRIVSGGQLRGSSLSAGEFGGAQLMRELIEHGVDHAGLLLVDEGGGDVNIFRHDDARRHIGPACKLVSAGAEHRP